ncbi:thiol:disulfide interchange protein DsbB [Crenobacter luteus]|uniref:disulfide bond formation protein B n=1 Tax=Crenobacter luteus TaxID=1452487 RepID=UPI00082E037B|nr:disulfide bond formation protein B [Crenobacter luteus]TCP12432.1 thiol:disulfide interchange protein DsbB [Crenobacter luteus]
MTKTIGVRAVFALLTLSCAAALAFALYLQHAVGLEPCPLCIFQRVGVMALGVFSLLGWLFAGSLRAARPWAALSALSALGGGAVAAWHVRLQHLPADQVPSCGPGLDYMIETMPFTAMLAKVFKGSGECAVVDWTFAGLSLPELTGLFFAGALALAAWNLFRRA